MRMYLSNAGHYDLISFRFDILLHQVNKKLKRIMVKYFVGHHNINCDSNRILSGRWQQLFPYSVSDNLPILCHF